MPVYTIMSAIKIFVACAVLVAFSTLALVGCGTFNVPVVPTAKATYRAYGDSITQGYTLSEPLTQAYPPLVALFEKVTFTNNALDGDEACDVTTRQIFPNGDSPTFAEDPTYTVLIGTNDVDRSDATTYEPTFTLCHRAIVSWLGLPVELKVLAGGSGASTSGPGALNKTDNWDAWSTQGAGSSISFTITTAREGAIYAWPIIDDTSSASYSYWLDGVAIGSSDVSSTPKVSTYNGTTQSLGFLRFASVPSGTHVVSFVQTSPGSSGVSIVGIGSPAITATGPLPAVLAGTIPYQYHESGSGRCTPTDPLCLAYIQDIEDDASLLSADGLKVGIFDTRKYMMGTAAEMNDPLHPNALGQEEISHSVEAAW
jgi:lysophospholipase L1-like esterase